jgi:ketosteroid isomerase-like protein
VTEAALAADTEAFTRSFLQEVRDRREIEALKFAYCRSADALDVDGMVSTFTQDCTINFRADGGDRRRGLDALRHYFSAALFGVTSSSHHLSNLDIVFLGPDRAALQCALYSWKRFVGYPEVKDRHRWVRYEDVFVRTPDGWRQRELLFLVAGEIGGGLSPRLGELAGRPVWPATVTGCVGTGEERS